MASFIANVGDRGFHRAGLFVDCELLEADVAAKNRPNWYRPDKRTKMWSVADVPNKNVVGCRFCEVSFILSLPFDMYL